jgi:hypothetical protein
MSRMLHPKVQSRERFARSFARRRGNYPLLEIGALPLPTKQPPTLTDVASNSRTSAIDFIM